MTNKTQRIPWHNCPADELDPKDPLASDWRYVTFDPSLPQKIIVHPERPTDAEILASPLLAPLQNSKNADD